MFEVNDRVKVIDGTSTYLGSTGFVKEVLEGRIYRVRFSDKESDNDLVAELDLELVPEVDGGSALSLLLGYGDPDDDAPPVAATIPNTTTVRNTAKDTTPDTSTTAQAVWAQDGLSVYNNGTCYDDRTNKWYASTQDGQYYFADETYYTLDTTRPRAAWLSAYQAPAQQEPALGPAIPQGYYDQRSGQMLYPVADGTYVDGSYNSYYYDGQQFVPVQTVQNPVTPAPAPTPTRTATTDQQRQSADVGNPQRKRRLDVPNAPNTRSRTEPTAPTAARQQNPVRNPARNPAPQPAQQPAQVVVPTITGFDVGRRRFVLEYAEGGRNEQHGHSVQRHFQEYLASVGRGTQGLRNTFYNTQVYSADVYIAQLQQTCDQAATTCDGDPASYGQRLDILDGNNRPWQIILMRGRPGEYLIRHAHLENYQRQ